MRSSQHPPSFISPLIRTQEVGAGPTSWRQPASRNCGRRFQAPRELRLLMPSPVARRLLSSADSITSTIAQLDLDRVLLPYGSRFS
jgi:hypothetical protein